MTFPDAPLGERLEVNLGGTWTDLTSRIDHPPMTIGRGHPDESTTVSASTFEAELANGDAALSPDNPESPYYPWLVQNVPLRVSIPADANYLRIEDSPAGAVRCPDRTSLRVTGDLELQLDFWRSTDQAGAVASKSDPAGTHAWLLEVVGGRPRLFWSPDGSSLPSATANAPLPSGRVTLRVTLAVATGTVTFYTGPAPGGPWTQLGDPVIAGATSLFASTAPMIVAGDNNTAVFGRYYEFRMLNGIGGTLVANPVFSAQSAGATSFSDAQGNPYTVVSAEISDRDYRGYFEWPEMPQDESPFNPGQDGDPPAAAVSASAGGLLRRYSQRTNPSPSSMYRGWTKTPAAQVVAYWPMEDLKGASRFGPAIGSFPMTFGGSALPQLASNSDFACSNPLPVINGATASAVVRYGGSWAAGQQFAFLLEIPSGGEADNSSIARMTTSGTVAFIELLYRASAGGQLLVTGWGSAGSQLFNSGPQTIGGAMNGRQVLAWIYLAPHSGGGVDWEMAVQSPFTDEWSGWGGTQAGATIGAVTEVALNPDGDLLDTVLGHAALQAAAGPPPVSDALDCHRGEPAGVRISRVCGEEGIPFRSRGNMSATQLMGLQTPQTVQQLIQEAADTDRGVWTELRQQLGWGYIARTALYNQPAQVAVDYAQDHLSQWTSPPTRDDQVTVNDVTVNNADGSSSRQFAAPGQPISGGRLSTLNPGSGGVGTYDQEFPVNLLNDSDTDDEAGWILHMGTVDQPRFPGIMLDLSNRALAAQFPDILTMDLGDRLTIDNPSRRWGRGQVTQIAQQLTETIGPEELTVAVTGVPELPYEVGQAGTDHADTDGTTLNAGVSTTATSWGFKTAAGLPLWSTNAADYPAGVISDGEALTVTAMSGSSSPQTATVVRSVNGVVKVHAAGAVISVWTPPVAGL